MRGRTKVIVAAAAFWAERGLAESRGVEKLRDSQLNFGAVYRAEMIRVDRIVRGVPKAEEPRKKAWRGR